ncbi:MAG: PEP-CTERM sorting domain-containing protein [Verrucomicrobiales bacterium]
MNTRPIFGAHRLLLGALFSATQMQGAITIYTDRTAWENAVSVAGGTAQTEDLNGIATETSFGAAPLTTSLGLTIYHTSAQGFPSGQNSVQNDGGAYNMNGSNYLQVDDDDPFAAGNLEFTFTAGTSVSSLGFDYRFFGEEPDQGLTSNLGLIQTKLENTSPGDLQTRFFGFVDDDPSQHYTLFRFTGENIGYSIDNISFAETVPEPGTGILGLIAATLLFKRKRQLTQDQLSL